MTARQARDTTPTCDCGWVGHPTTPGLAQYSLRRHSCDAHLERVARAQRRLDRLAASGPQRPCRHGGRHPHGSRVRYVVDKCRCRPCRDSASKFERARTRQRLYGRTAYVDAGPARAHVRGLGVQGMGWKRVAARAGVHPSTVWKLLYGDPARGMAPSKRCRATTAAKLIAVGLDLADHAIIPGAGTARRLQGLVAIGWSGTRLADRLGIGTGRNLHAVIHGSQAGVFVSTAWAVAALYDELWDQAPPQATRGERGAYTRSVRYARRAGWVPPLAWDDDTIDDPAAAPDIGAGVEVVEVDEVVVQRRAAGDRTVQLNAAERAAVITALASAGLTVCQISDRAGINQAAVSRHLQKAAA